MFWNDLLVDRNLSNYELVTAISQIFNVLSAEVLVVDDIAEAEVSEDVRLLCERTPVQGDFSMKVFIYLYDSELKQLDSVSTVKQLCTMLHCKCLMSDDSINPYSMLLLQESENTQTAFLDPEKLDEYEEYIMVE